MRKMSFIFIAALALTIGLPTLLPAQTVSTIANAKRDVAPMDFWVDDTLTFYQVTGRVTSPDYARREGSITNVEVYIQDTNGDGFAVFFNPDEAFNEWSGDASDFVLGYEVEIQGFVGQTNGNRFITPSVPDFHIDFTDMNPVHPAPVADTITNLLDNAEAYEGSFIIVSNVSYSGTWPGYGQNGFLTADDGTASMDLFIDRDTSIDGQLPPTNDTFIVQGIFSQYDDTTNNLPNGPNAGYQILPRYYSDFIQDVPANSPPSLILTPSGTVAAGEDSELSIRLLGQDRNAGDTLFFGNLSGFGAVADVGYREANFLWTPPQGGTVTNEVTLTVTDGLTTVTDSVTVVVQQIPTNFWDFEGWEQGWSQYDNGGTTSWAIDNDDFYDPGAETSEWYWVVSGYQAGAVSDDWLVSPALDLTSYTDPQLNYWRYRVFDGPLLRVWASATYTGTGDPWLHSWDDLGYTAESTFSDWEREIKSLAAYAGNSSVYVAFQYTSNGPDAGQSREYRVDQIRLEEAPANEPPVIVAPVKNQVVPVGGTLSLEVLTTEVDGDLVTIVTNAAPANSTFTDNTDGTADYGFTPDVSQVGTQVVSFIASDVHGADTNTIEVVVYETIVANTLWDFELGVAPWFEYSVASDEDWQRRDFSNEGAQGAEGSDWYMYMNGYQSDVPSDDWLISPKIDLTGFTDPEILYYVFQEFAAPTGPDVTFHVSTDYTGTGDPSGATWSDLTFAEPTGAPAWGPRTNNLSAYTGSSSVFLAFRYEAAGTTGADTELWQVDQIRLREVPVDVPPEISPVLVDRVVTVSNTLVFSITTVEPDGDTITIADVPSLANSTLTSLSNGTSSYSFTPVTGQIGDHVVSFIASDVDGADTNTITISVLPPSSDGSGMIISEVVDATLSGGNPKFVEITNTDDLDYTFIGGGIVVQSNADTNYVIDVDLAGITIAAGQSFVIQSSGNGGSNVFYDTYGFDADLYTTAGFSNGDDRYILASADNGGGVATTFLDIHGEDGVDGSGSAWEYLDGYAYRLPAYVNGNGLGFVVSEWFHSGPNALDGADGPTIVALTSPGTHDYVGAGPVDSDGDGMYDDDEIFAGTNPNDSNSFFAISAIVATPDVDITLRDTTNARVYQVEFTIDISDPNSWSNLAPAVVGTEPDTVITDTSGDIDRNYRGKVMMP